MSKGKETTEPTWTHDCLIKGGTRLAIGTAAGIILAMVIPARRNLCALAGFGVGLGMAGAACAKERAIFLEKHGKKGETAKSKFESLLPKRKEPAVPKKPSIFDTKIEPKKEIKSEGSD